MMPRSQLLPNAPARGPDEPCVFEPRNPATLPFCGATSPNLPSASSFPCREPPRVAVDSAEPICGCIVPSPPCQLAYLTVRPCRSPFTIRVSRASQLPPTGAHPHAQSPVLESRRTTSWTGAVPLHYLAFLILGPRTPSASSSQADSTVSAP